MKSLKLILVLTLSVFCFQAEAQKAKRTSAWNYLKYGELDKAKEAIDQAVEHEKTKDDAQTWYYKGLIYMRIMADTNEEVRGLAENPVGDALDAFEKSKSLDNKGRYKSDIDQQLFEVVSNFFNVGIEAYNKAVQSDKEGDFAMAFGIFDMYLKALHVLDEANQQQFLNSLRENDIDPLSVNMYAGYSALKSGQEEEAKELFTKLIKEDYDDPFAYLSLSEIYLTEGDTNKALEVLEVGKVNVVENKDITLTELQIYQQSGRVDELIEKLQNAIKEEPENSLFYLVLAGSYDALAASSREEGNMDQAQEFQDKAMKTYEEAIEIDPENFEINNNIGITFYNNAVELIQESQKIKDYRKAGKMQEQAKEVFKEALPYLEKAYHLDCGGGTLYNVLNETYIRTGNSDKVEDLDKARKNNATIVVETGQADLEVKITYADKTSIHKSNASGRVKSVICLTSGKVEIEIEEPESGKVQTTVYQGDEKVFQNKKDLNVSFEL